MKGVRASIPVLFMVLGVPQLAEAITIGKLELAGGNVRIEGENAVNNATIFVDGIARGSADGRGRYRIEFDGFVPEPSCVITVSDKTGQATRNVPNCTPATNNPPVANAGPDQIVDEGAAVSLNGSGSDADGDPLTFGWTQTVGPLVTLSGAGTAQASFVAPDVAADTLLTFRLTVTDAPHGDSGSDTVNVTVRNVAPANQAPIANAGPDQTVVDTDGDGFAPVTLDGSLSSDPDGMIVSYNWTTPAGPFSGQMVAVSLPVRANVVTLTVEDNQGATATDSVTITVTENDCSTGGDAGDLEGTGVLVSTPIVCSGILPGVDQQDRYKVNVTETLQILTGVVTDFFGAIELVDPDGFLRIATGTGFDAGVFFRLCTETGVNGSCSGGFFGKAFSFTLDKVGQWEVMVGKPLTSFVTETYTLSLSLGGGGDDCVQARDPVLLSPLDAPNSDPGGELSLTLMEAAPEVNCSGSLPAGVPEPSGSGALIFDEADSYNWSVVADEPVSIAVVPPVPTHPTLGDVKTDIRFPQTPTLLGGEFVGSLTAVLTPRASGIVFGQVYGFLEGNPPANSRDYQLFVATGSRHDGDCFTGLDAANSFLGATVIPAPACIGDVSAADIEDWYSFTAALGEEISVNSVPDGSLGRPTAPVEVYDPDNINRGTGPYLIDKPGAWRVRVTTDLVGLPHFEGSYAIEIERRQGVPGHDCGSGGDAPTEGLPVMLPVDCQGDLLPSGDLGDKYTFDLQAGQTLTAAAAPSGLSDYSIILTDPSGIERTRARTGPGGAAGLSFVADAAGTWTLSLEMHLSDRYDRVYSLQISATAAPPPTQGPPDIDLQILLPQQILNQGQAAFEGDQFTVTVVSSNQGTGPANGVSVTLTTSGPGEARLKSPATVFLGDLAPGQGSTNSWTVEAKKGPGITLTFTAQETDGTVVGQNSVSLAVFK